ncbi:MAG: phosphorylase [Burkholderiaceae bacterium]|nr:phosphorylase [Burkholderiaceae bacterium]
MSTDFLRLVDERTRSALASGDLKPIVTEQTELVDDDLRFVVRSVSTLAGKDAAIPGGPRDPNFNPFLSPDPALKLGPLGERHTAILNKFPVSARHIVIVTNEFREQLEPLDRCDFAALARVLVEAGGLGFYNGGAQAGASQRHKHLQWIPQVPGNASLAGWLPGLPRDAAPLATARHPRLAFAHCFVRVDCRVGMSCDRAADGLHAGFERAIEALGLGADGNGLLPPSNLLIADGWLMLVPRSREHFEEISINALAFGGTFFVREAAKLQALRAAGPLRALAAVGA